MSSTRSSSKRRVCIASIILCSRITRSQSVSCSVQQEMVGRLCALREKLSLLPEANRDVLKYLLEFLTLVPLGFPRFDSSLLDLSLIQRQS